MSRNYDMRSSSSWDFIFRELSSSFGKNVPAIEGVFSSHSENVLRLCSFVEQDRLVRLLQDAAGYLWIAKIISREGLAIL